MTTPENAGGPKGHPSGMMIEGLVGAAIGGLVGIGLVLAKIVSPVGAVGVAAGVGIGSAFNAWRRARKAG